MVKFMVTNRQLKFFEGYVQRVNPSQCPAAVGALLYLDQWLAFISPEIGGIISRNPMFESVILAGTAMAEHPNSEKSEVNAGDDNCDRDEGSGDRANISK